MREPPVRGRRSSGPHRSSSQSFIPSARAHVREGARRVRAVSRRVALDQLSATDREIVAMLSEHRVATTAADRNAARAPRTHGEVPARSAVEARDVLGTPAVRESHGGEGRIKAARFPARKSLEEFDFDHARALRRDQIAHLGTLDFVAARENVVFLGPPGLGKTHLAIGLAIRACQAGHRVAFATASGWVARLAEAHHAGRLQNELGRLGRYPLLVVDEVGYIPFEPEAANLFFQLVSSRYERVSLIVTSNKPFGRWGEVFGDDVVAAAMIDRLVHHAEVISLKGDSCRLKDRDLGRVPAGNGTEE